MRKIVDGAARLIREFEQQRPRTELNEAEKEARRRILAEFIRARDSLNDVDQTIREHRERIARATQTPFDTEFYERAVRQVIRDEEASTANKLARATIKFTEEIARNKLSQLATNCFSFFATDFAAQKQQVETGAQLKADGWDVVHEDAPTELPPDGPALSVVRQSPI